MFDNTLPKGTYIKGKSFSYEIISVLGQGTFGITYKAKMFFKTQDDDGLMVDGELIVALKEYFVKSFNGREGSSVTNTDESTPTFNKYKKTFEHESENLRFMIHPHIVRVYDYFEENDTAYYSMELFEGGSLDQKIGKYGNLSEEEALRHIREIGTALSYMHDYKMLHLDIKPGNIMLNDEGEAVLIDFGLSKQYGEDGIAIDNEGVEKGTPGYAPLEQSEGCNSVDFLATLDIYALAGTLYKMLTGERPPLASSIKNDGFPLYKLEQLNLTEEIIHMVFIGMHPDYTKRPNTVDKFLDLCKPKCDYYGSAQLIDRASTTQDKKIALKLYKEAFALDCTNAQTAYNIADIYYMNIQDDVKAAEWYLKAGKLGLVDRNLGEIYEQGCGVPVNLKKAILWWREAAKNGDSLALSHLGDLYYDGRGVTQDYSEALRFYKKSIEQNKDKEILDSYKEFFCLGYMYEKGLGIEKNINIALKYYHRVADAFENKAKSILDDVTCRVSDSMFQIGCIYLFGNDVDIDYANAFKWFSKAAIYEMPAAQYNLGCMYSEGQGVIKNYEMAFSWFMKAALQEYSLAEYNVGISYQYGYGCKQDYKKAEEWLQKAMDHQHPKAQDALNTLKQQVVKKESTTKSIFTVIKHLFG